MTMTPLPSAPTRANPTNFATAADAFVSALPQFVTDANALQADVTTRQNDVITRQSDVTTRQADVVSRQADVTTKQGMAASSASAAAASAASAANAPGTSATIAGSLTIGMGNQTFTLDQTGKAFSIGQTVIIASSTSPAMQMSGVITAFNSATGAMSVAVNYVVGNGSTYTGWVMSLAGVRGAPGTVTGSVNRQSSATSLMLTISSANVQALTFTASGQSVTLPDATTMGVGTQLFLFRNEGSINYTVKDNAGNTKAVVGSGQTVGFYLMDNTTATGIWAVTNQNFDGSVLSDLFINTIATQGSTTMSNVQVAPLSATSAIGISRINTTGAIAFIITVSGTTLSIGNITTVLANLSVNYVGICALSSTTAIALVGDPSVNSVRAFVLTISGSTITVGGSVTVDSTTQVLRSNIVALTTATALVCSGANSLCLISVSGTTPTIGSTATLGTSGQFFYYVANIAVISPTQVLIVGENGTSPSPTYSMSAVIATISGTTVTVPNTPITFSPGNTSVPLVAVAAVLSSSLAIAFYSTQSGGMAAILIGINGINLTFIGSGTPIDTFVNGGVSAYPVSANKVLLTYPKTNTNASMTCTTVYVNSTQTITIGTSQTFSSSYVSNGQYNVFQNLAALSNKKILFVQSLEGSSYLLAGSILEVLS